MPGSRHHDQEGDRGFEGHCQIRDHKHTNKSHTITPEMVCETLSTVFKSGNAALKNIMIEWLSSISPCSGCMLTDDEGEIIGGVPVLVIDPKGACIRWHSSPSYCCGLHACATTMCKWCAHNRKR